jgi:hypothetical protein
MVLDSLDCDMKLQIHKFAFALGLLAIALLAPGTAEAFRCGTKLVKEGMHEAEVVAICGEPTSMRHLGYAVRLLDYRDRRPGVPGWTLSRGPSHALYPAEVMVTEYVYNLGPRKFMRRLVFEGGLLATVEKLGRGYRE